MRNRPEGYARAAARVALSVLIGLFVAGRVNADGNVINKVYHPYVDALESEIEMRSLFQDRESGANDFKQKHQLSYGRSFGQALFGEAAIVGERSRNNQFELEAFEFELKWQLTEQGEYSADWGLLFEYEQLFNEDIHEFTAGVLIEKEFGRWSGATNLMFTQEWGSNIDDEFEAAIALQARYRHSRAFEPALEVYAGQDSAGIGPVVMGSAFVGVRKSIRWEAGMIFGIGNNSPDNVVRLLFEFEF